MASVNKVTDVKKKLRPFLQVNQTQSGTKDAEVMGFLLVRDTAWTYVTAVFRLEDENEFGSFYTYDHQMFGTIKVHDGTANAAVVQSLVAMDIPWMHDDVNATPEHFKTLKSHIRAINRGQLSFDAWWSHFEQRYTRGGE